jgi:integrase
MATLETISLRQYEAKSGKPASAWIELETGHLTGMPQICWANGMPWREANLWLFIRCEEKHSSTAMSDATALHAFARWLEETKTDWLHFPLVKRDRCLNRFRSALIHARDEQTLAPSTATSRMRVVVRFYRWLSEQRLGPDIPTMWEDSSVAIRTHDFAGFHRSINVTSSSLRLRNRRIAGLGLEDGLTPLAATERDAAIEFARDHASPELHLMLAIGFLSGMRLGSICDLKIQTLINATVDPASPSVAFLAIGPGTQPPVATKFGVTGNVLVPTAWLNELKGYCYSTRRLAREVRARPELKSHVFLTSRGNTYTQRPGANKSSAINTEMHRFRAKVAEHGLRVPAFKFHQTRATFATAVARIAVEHMDLVAAVGVVRELLLHKDEAMSLRYIKFVQTHPLKEAIANEFSRLLSSSSYFDESVR